MRTFLASALGALAISASLPAVASAAQLDTKDQPTMSGRFIQQGAANLPDHVGNTRADAGRGFIVAAGVEHGPTVAQEQPDQNMYYEN